MDGRGIGKGIVKALAPAFSKRKREEVRCPAYDEDRGVSFLVDGEIWRCVGFPKVPEEWVGKTVLHLENPEDRSRYTLCAIALVDSISGSSEKARRVRLMLLLKEGSVPEDLDRRIEIEGRIDEVICQIRFVEADAQQ